MAQYSCDAIVFFGATGDLAFKKIFPALQKLARRRKLEMPVIGVAKSGWQLQQLEERAKDSVETYGGVDPEAFAKLISRLQYIDGDYSDPGTFSKLRQHLGPSQHPLHYLAIPPVLFPEVVKQLSASGCATGGRVVIEKPFGHDMASAHTLNEIVHGAFAEEDVFRIDHFLGKNTVKMCCISGLPIRTSNQFGIVSMFQSVQITMAEDFG